ncbi:MAG: hypothetical protein LBQ27_00100 [Clostridiales bacterium]|nr:hypothetical protein [Clostridiales bacterium]
MAFNIWDKKKKQNIFTIVISGIIISVAVVIIVISTTVNAAELKTYKEETVSYLFDTYSEEGYTEENYIKVAKILEEAENAIKKAPSKVAVKIDKEEAEVRLNGIERTDSDSVG